MACIVSGSPHPKSSATLLMTLMAIKGEQRSPNISRSGVLGTGNFTFPAREIDDNEHSGRSLMRLNNAWMSTVKKILPSRNFIKICGSWVWRVSLVSRASFKLLLWNGAAASNTTLTSLVVLMATPWWGKVNKIGQITQAQMGPLPRPHNASFRRPRWIFGRAIRSKDLV